MDNTTGERLFTEQEVKDKKKGSWVGGLVIGALATIASGVILNKAAKVNIVDGASGLVDKGIDLVRGKKKTEPKQVTEENVPQE
jgi:hypothetical protein